GNNFYLFNNKSAFRFNSDTRNFEWYFDLKQTGNFDYAYAFPTYLPFNDSLVVIRSKTGFLSIINLKTGEEKLVYINKKILNAELNDRMIMSLTADNKGGIWIGTAQMGIINYNLFTGELAQYIHEPDNPNSLPGNLVNMILPDEKGVVWASCYGHGLIKMEPVTPLFKTAVPTVSKNSKNSLTGWRASIRGFLETDDGYWVGTMNGLFGYSIQTHQYSNLQYLLPEFHSARGNSYERKLSEGTTFGSLAKDHSGNVWIGPWYGELLIYNTKLQRSFPIIPQTFKDRHESVFRNLYCDKKNRMWISTQTSGVSMIDCNSLNLQKINDIKFEYHFPDAKDSTAITPGIAFVVSEDAQGNIWAGTENGLCRYNEKAKKWKRYVNIPGDDNSIHNSNVRSICLDNKGTLWIGTNGGGLNRYNKEQDNFSHFTKANGLPDDRIYSLVCDNNGMLWMGTNYGLCRFNPFDYSCKNFSEKDGIQNYEYNTGAVIKLKDGILLFGGVAGYNIIDPDKIENKKLIPPVVISSFKIFDRETPIGDGNLKLNHDENSFAFEFAALSYFQNQKNRYAYRLEGVDPDWIFSDTRRYVSYSRLQPGDYTFNVKACNSEGVWNESGARFNIFIKSPWWERWWALLIYASLSVGILYLSIQVFKKRLLLKHQLKTEQDESFRLKELDTFKSQLFTNLTHEFRTPLTVILGMAKQLTSGNWTSIVAVNEKARISQGLTMIENNGRNLLQLINQLLDLSKLENKSFKLQNIQGDIIPYLRYVTESFQSYAEDIGLYIHFLSDVDLLKMDFDPEQTKQVLTNLISNALKFTPSGGEIIVSAGISDGQLSLNVTDTGIGISEKDLPYIMDRFYQADSSTTRIAQGTGIGLAHTEELLKIMGGSISLKSELGKGTSITILLPVKNEASLVEDEIALPTKPHLAIIRSHAETISDDTSSRDQHASSNETFPQLLIIEDNRDVVEYLRSCLEDQYLISVAYDGKAGIEKAFENIPDFIISDVMMPEMDGYQV
ncbi:MAG TPA: two-component regulator propeller domain-containing protein, partial [Flavitalea sp.]|nr:two-component regulator propeller domain-containing protein [Flavitalea sp.]